MKRKKEREIIVLSLYSIEISGNDINETINYMLENNENEENFSEYVYQSLEGVLNNKAEIDELISKNLKNYKINRLSILDLSIIRFACYELLHVKDIPSAVIINEAVDFTKKYCDLNDGKASAFNNSLLDNIKEDLS